jgi:hypothetical protein
VEPGRMSLPVWTALTAVLAGKLVSKVTPDGTAWVATATGTTGAVEPAWPTTDPWTVADGSIGWAITTAFRTLSTAGVLATLTNFRNANPNLLKGLAPERPKSLTNLDLPGAYITGADETVTYGQQLETRTLNGLSVMLVDVVPDNIEAGARMDVLVDGIVGAFAAAFHAIDGKSILQLTSVTDVPLDEGGIPYYGVLVSLGGAFQTRGVQSS